MVRVTQLWNIIISERARKAPNKSPDPHPIIMYSVWVGNSILYTIWNTGVWWNGSKSLRMRHVNISIWGNWYRLGLEYWFISALTFSHISFLWNIFVAENSLSQKTGFYSFEKSLALSSRFKQMIIKPWLSVSWSYLTASIRLLPEFTSGLFEQLIKLCKNTLVIIRTSKSGRRLRLAASPYSLIYEIIKQLIFITYGTYSMGLFLNFSVTAWREFEVTVSNSFCNIWLSIGNIHFEIHTLKYLQSAFVVSINN